MELRSFRTASTLRFRRLMTSAFGIIRNGRLVDARRRLRRPADILIKGDTILSVGPPGLDAPDGATLIDASDRALMPGLVNAHVHGHAYFPLINRPPSTVFISTLFIGIVLQNVFLVLFGPQA